jgi:hypothetical protein
MLALAGGGIQAAGALKAGEIGVRTAQLQTDLYNANTDLLNKQAEIAQLGVDFAAIKGRLMQSRIQDAGDQTLRSQRVVWASNNLDPSYGSPAVIAGRTAARVESDLELAQANTEIEKADALTKVANIRGAAVSSAGGALSSVLRGEAANDAAFYGAGTALLSGLSRTRWFNSGVQQT